VALRANLTAARLELEAAEANLSYVCALLNASGLGRVDDNSWDGALRFGALTVEFYREPTQGRFPRRARKWMRNLVWTLLEQRDGLRLQVAELTPQVAQLEALMAA
jgi:hypothetical protein